jgi:hypothetical protein
MMLVGSANGGRGWEITCDLARDITFRVANSDTQGKESVDHFTLIDGLQFFQLICFTANSGCSAVDEASHTAYIADYTV